MRRSVDVERGNNSCSGLERRTSSEFPTAELLSERRTSSEFQESGECLCKHQIVPRGSLRAEASQRREVGDPRRCERRDEGAKSERRDDVVVDPPAVRRG